VTAAIGKYCLEKGPETSRDMSKDCPTSKQHYKAASTFVQETKSSAM